MPDDIWGSMAAGLRDFFTADLEDVYKKKYGKASHYPTLRESYTGLMQDALMGMGVDKHTARRNAEGVMGLADWSPLGVLTSADDAQRAAAQGDIPGVLFGSLGAIPAAGKGVKAGEEVAKSIRGYHGSPSEFLPEPDHPLGRLDISESREGNYGKAGYFHEAQDDAARYKHEGGRVYEANLNISNPFYMDAPVKNADAIKIAEAFGNEKLANILKETGQDIRNGNELWHWSLAQGGSTEKKRRAIQAAGFDSIIGDPGKSMTGTSTRSREIAVFDPKLIEIVKKYGIAAALGAGLISEEMARQMQQQGIGGPSGT